MIDSSYDMSECSAVVTDSQYAIVKLYISFLFIPTFLAIVHLLITCHVD